MAAWFLSLITLNLCIILGLAFNLAQFTNWQDYLIFSASILIAVTLTIIWCCLSVIFLIRKHWNFPAFETLTEHCAQNRLSAIYSLAKFGILRILITLFLFIPIHEIYKSTAIMSTIFTFSCINTLIGKCMYWNCCYVVFEFVMDLCLLFVYFLIHIEASLLAVNYGTILSVFTSMYIFIGLTIIGIQIYEYFS